MPDFKVTHTTVSEGQRAFACASVANSFAAAGVPGALGAGLEVEAGGGTGLAGGAAAVGAGAGAAGAAVGAGAGAGGAAGAAVGWEGAAPPRH